MDEDQFGWGDEAPPGTTEEVETALQSVVSRGNRSVAIRRGAITAGSLVAVFVLSLSIAKLSPNTSSDGYAPLTNPRPDESTTTSSTTKVPIIPVGETACQEETPERSAAKFDPATGVYTVADLSVDTAAKTMTFNVVQYLGGEAAKTAYNKETGEAGYPPNDYWVVDASPKTYTLKYVDDVSVSLVALDEDGGLNFSKPGTVTQLSASIKAGNATTHANVRVKDSFVVGACQLYAP